MKNYIYSTIILFLISFSTFGQAPSWTVNENNFQYTMTFVGSLNIDGVRLANGNDKVAAFVNGECRGVTNLIYVATENKYYAYLTVFSNTNNETISFKMYDSANNVVKDVFKNERFASNANLGNLSQTYIFSNNTLQQGVDLLDVSFVGVTRNDITIVGNKVTVYLDPGQNVSALNTNFTTSPGATVYIGNNQLLSGSNTLDFTNPITFKVISEDQIKSKEWIVAVQFPVNPVTLPTTFTLSKLTIAENKPVGTLVGDFNVLIEDRVISNLSLIAGDGGFDNGSFEIIGNKLSVKSIFDFETKSSYKIRVQAISIRKEIIEKTFEITVLDDNLPTVFSLSKLTIEENQAVGTVVGDFTVIKEDRNSFALTLINGVGADDNASFEITGNSLKVKSIFDFETKSSYKIRVQAISTRGDVLEQTFNITVVDDNLPTVFSLSKLNIEENQPLGTEVGEFSVSIEDRIITNLSLVTGDGGFDNGAFEIVGNKLKVKNIFDFETKSSYKIRVKGVSARNEVLEKTFEITVLDDNLPTVFSLSKLTIDENQPIGTVVGDFAVKKEDRNSFALTLIEDVASDDNASFEITGNSLKVKSIFDFETKSSYNIRVRAISTRGDVLEQTFNITVIDDNSPTVFNLSKLTIDENQPIGTVVGDFTVIKEDRNVFTLSLIEGVGSDDNASFEITGNSLKVKSIFDFETKNSYKLRVKAISSRGDVLEQSFTITVLDDKLPTVFTLSKLTIEENQPIGTVVGDFTVKKEDRNSFALTLIEGVGSDDNASFEITGNSLKVKSIFDFETKNSYKIRVQAVSSRGDVLEQVFSITVIDDKMPTVFTLSKLTIDENQPIGTIVGDFNVIKEDRNAFTLTLIEGFGAEDNRAFEIAGNSLRVKNVFDFESKNLYKLRVQAVSSRGDVLEQSFTITVIDDKMPTIFTLSKLTIDENEPIGTVVGDFTTIIENRNAFNLTLDEGIGSENNDSFEITGTSLKVKEMFDFETKYIYKIRVKAENSLGEILFSTFVITINDINDTPVLITISNDKIKENLPAGTVIGTLKTKDQDKDSSIYSFFNSGSDYLNFDIVGDQLVLKKSLDFETQNVFEFELISNDQRGGEVKEKMTIYALNVNENPVITKNSGSSTIDFIISEVSNRVAVVGQIEATDVDADSTLTYEVVSDKQVPFTISNDGTISFNGTIDPKNRTNYTFNVKVTDNGSPKLSDTVVVTVTVELKVNDTFMYNNLVSPNGDGYNDQLIINNIDLYNDYTLAIYNSRGQIVFSTTNYKNDWMGNGLPEGEYYIYFSGKDQNNKERVYKQVLRLVFN